MNGTKTMNAEVTLDGLDTKLAAAFPGRIVRKDLVKKLKVGFNVPVYVLEYLLGKYCSTTNEEEIRIGLEQVKSAISERIVRVDHVHISSEIVHAHERLLTGGVWANIELVYDDSLGTDGAIRPFVIHRLA